VYCLYISITDILHVKIYTMTKKPDQRSIRVESGEVFIIQKSIPVSGTYRALGPSLRYPFKDMQSGESFEVKVSKNDARRKVANLSSACASYVKRSNNAARFTVRRTSDTTIRCWRIK
jgi:hypothetical protein